MIISSLEDAFTQHSEIANRYFGKYAPNEIDSFAAMNGAFWQSGVFIHVKENTSVEKPIFIMHVNDAVQQQVVAQTRVLTLVEKDSSLTIVEKFESVGGYHVFHNFCEEIVVAEESKLEYYKVQNDAGKSIQVANTVIHQSDNSKVDTFTLTLNGEIVRNNFSIVIDGENCESHFMDCIC